MSSHENPGGRQSDVIGYALRAFSEKLVSGGREWAVEFASSLDPGEITRLGEEKSPCLAVIPLGIREKPDQGAREQIVRRETDAEGREFEYYTRPATIMELSLVVYPLVKDLFARLGLVGEVVQTIHDDPFTPVGEYDWAGNQNEPLMWEVVPPAPAWETRFPSSWGGSSIAIGVRTQIGIDSSVKERFRRVEARQMRAIKKKES
ncbi:hypothetical protein [Alkalispirochaeta alkalica]|uniref:hypothetical protein n=1 Tax=Alkalispirochaeta alkalica TaxID=46356 RepID=UPI000366B6AA|nr:hypothetical protein [Alkalispirochaeta alkalica]